jgi:Leucine-rich repeat (LRR) protein
MDIPALGANKLAALSLAGNKLTGGVPEGLAAHPVLTRLDLADNLLTALPRAWAAQPAAGGGEAPPLALLRLSGNQLSGGFPAGLAAYASLEALELDGNRLRQGPAGGGGGLGAAAHGNAGMRCQP